MTLRDIHPGDVVRCQVDGETFHALVDCRPVVRGLAVRPIERGVAMREVSARQVVAHWRWSKRSQVPG